MTDLNKLPDGELGAGTSRRPGHIAEPDMGDRSVVERLNAALAEQSRLGEQYQRSLGTSAELSSFRRLQEANLRVGLCQRAADASERRRRPVIDPRSTGATAAESSARQMPPGPERAFAFSIAGGATAPGAARDGVAERLNGTLDEALLDTLRLLVSEVATNCVQHANADARSRIDIAVSSLPGAVRVELSTAGVPFERPPANPQKPPPSEPHGRGLVIVDTLARAWGVGPHSANHVWFELAIAGAGR